MSLTPASRDDAREFVRTFQVDWPCLYAAPTDALVALGALGKLGDFGEVFPTLYVVGPDGTVRWCDQRARYNHEQVGVILRKLHQAIEEALKAG